MTGMPAETPDVAFAGQRLKHRVQLALALSGVLPLLVLAYVTHGFVLPQLDAMETTRLYGLQFLLFFTVLAMLGGGYIIWDLGRTIDRMAQMMANQRAIKGIEDRSDEVGTLMQSFNKMFATIEQQATEINNFASRLDSAYKELESTNSKLKETSFKDEVTGLYNRRFFMLRLEEEISRFRRFNHPAAIVLVDLDGFKAVNDECGHNMGDETLRDVAQILMKHSRGINVVARYGGDEFAILLVETSKAGAKLYADRIRQVVATFPYSHGKKITASFGVASLPDDDSPGAEELFHVADEALYVAKRAGKNQVAAAGSAEKVP